MLDAKAYTPFRELPNTFISPTNNGTNKNRNRGAIISPLFLK